MHREKLSTTVKPIIVFVIVAAVLGSLVWLGWSLLHRQYSLPVVDDLQSNVKVNVGVVGAPQSLDIRTNADTALDQALIGNVYETLIATDSQNKLTAGLASKWSVSDDGLTYTFSMRRAQFANGDTLDASDAAWSLKKIIEKQYQGADRLTAISGVAANGTKLTITLREPDPRLLRTLSGRAGIVYDSQQAGLDFATQTAGSGPFIVEHFQPGQRIVLERNADYWGVKAKAASITLMYRSSTADLAAALNNKEIDAAVALDQSAVSTITVPDMVVKQGRSTRKIILGMSNNTASILSDKRYRQAVRYLVDRQAMTDALGGGETLNGPFAPLDEHGSDGSADIFPHDTAKGTELISYFRYRSGARRPLTFVCPQRYGDAGAKIGELLQQTLGSDPANVDLTVNMVDDATWQQTVVQDRNFDFTLYEVDGEDDLDALMGDESFIAFVSADSQQAWDTALHSATADEYAKNFKTFATMLNDDSPVDWICARKPITVYANDLTGLPSNMTYTRIPLVNVTSAN
ncbi:ABC transporter substrate-binding protein [Bifidobacterium goeldii]|uniref:ABC transporter substrate-binding protein n=1 Tax=Bifidobacterium goeldii TaxID=2306975 RepID=A0A430FE61_9BIFI|nr:ABC transporter substrate-binding protein [Bifidobacterium goeldii]RSX51042.1 ABC transporter substrate-binding protein [Bifidobacterium goeldii]